MISNPTKSPRTAALYAETLDRPLEYQLARMTMLCEELERDKQLLVDAAEDASNFCAELYAKYSLKIGPFSSQAQVINGKLRTAIDAAIASQKEAGRG